MDRGAGIDGVDQAQAFSVLDHSIRQTHQHGITVVGPGFGPDANIGIVGGSDRSVDVRRSGAGDLSNDVARRRAGDVGR